MEQPQEMSELERLIRDFLGNDENRELKIKAYLDALDQQNAFYLAKKQQDKDFNLDAALTSWRKQWLASLQRENPSRQISEELKTTLEAEHKALLKTKPVGLSEGAVPPLTRKDSKEVALAQKKLNEMFVQGVGGLTLKPANAEGLSGSVRNVFLPRFTATYRQNMIDVLLEAQDAGIQFKLNLDDEKNIKPSLRQTFFFEALRRGLDPSHLQTTNYEKYLLAYYKKYPDQSWRARQAELKTQRVQYDSQKKPTASRQVLQGAASAGTGLAWVPYTQPAVFFSPALDNDTRGRYLEEMSYFQKFSIAMNRDCPPWQTQAILNGLSHQELVDCFNVEKAEWWHRAVRVFLLLKPIVQKQILQELNPGLQRVIYLSAKPQETRFFPLPWKDLHEATMGIQVKKILEALRSQAVLPTELNSVLQVLGKGSYDEKKTFVEQMRQMNRRGNTPEARNKWIRDLLIDQASHLTPKQDAAQNLLAATLCWVDKDDKRLLEVFSKIKERYKADKAVVYSILSRCSVRVLSKLAERGALEDVWDIESMSSLRTDQRAAVFLGRWKNWGKEHFYEYLGEEGSKKEDWMRSVLNEPGVLQALAKESRGQRPFRNRFRFISGPFDLENEKSRECLERLLSDRSGGVYFETKLAIVDKLLSLLRNHIPYKAKVLLLLKASGFLEAGSQIRIASSLSDENKNLYRALYFSEQTQRDEQVSAVHASPVGGQRVPGAMEDADIVLTDDSRRSSLSAGDGNADVVDVSLNASSTETAKDGDEQTSTGYDADDDADTDDASDADANDTGFNVSSELSDVNEDDLTYSGSEDEPVSGGGANSPQHHQAAADFPSPSARSSRDALDGTESASESPDEVGALEHSSSETEGHRIESDASGSSSDALIADTQELFTLSKEVEDRLQLLVEEVVAMLGSASRSLEDSGLTVEQLSNQETYLTELRQLSDDMAATLSFMPTIRVDSSYDLAALQSLEAELRIREEAYETFRSRLDALSTKKEKMERQDEIPASQASPSLTDINELPRLVTRVRERSLSEPSQSKGPEAGVARKRSASAPSRYSASENKPRGFVQQPAALLSEASRVHDDRPTEEVAVPFRGRPLEEMRGNPLVRMILRERDAIEKEFQALEQRVGVLRDEHSAECANLSEADRRGEERLATTLQEVKDEIEERLRISSQPVTTAEELQTRINDLRVIYQHCLSSIERWIRDRRLMSTINSVLSAERQEDNGQDRSVSSSEVVNNAVEVQSPARPVSPLNIAACVFKVRDQLRQSSWLSTLGNSHVDDKPAQEQLASTKRPSP